MPKAKILIVDDEPALVKMVGVRLRSIGYEVVEARDGEEGIEKVKSEAPDLIILDIMMPKMDGYEVCHKLKSDKRYRMIPIIYFSTIDLKDYASVKRKSEPDAFVSKPFDLPVLLEMIEKLLNK